MNSQSQVIPDQGSYLPNFCFSETNLILILVVELLAIVLALSGIPTAGLFVHIALISVYMQWVALSSAAILCLMKKTRIFQGHTGSTASSLITITIITIFMCSIAYYTSSLLRLGLFQQQSFIVVVLEHLAISLILSGLALRYFYVQHNNKLMIKTESQARLQALQARIRPHFLFNSLNTIASLTYTDPERAEQAIENLADLFRASLNANSSILLEDEIDLTREYIELEYLRLDERLTVDWTIDANLKKITLPALTLQPLVENAIYHGIEPLESGGKVTISILQQQDLSIEITNPLNTTEENSHRQGNHMALNNIAERLQIAFQGKAKIEHIAQNNLYRVTIKIPIPEENPS